jgi:uncharacterized protein (DUF4415 family)
LPLLPRERDSRAVDLGEEGRPGRGARVLEGKTNMRDHYDFSKMKGRKNPYTKYLKQPVTMRLDRDTIAYFKAMAEESGIPYQTLINLYLRDCAVQHRKLHMEWAS